MRIFLISCLVFLVLLSCSSERIIVNKFPNYIEIQKGDSVCISWEFLNAKFVRVSGYDYDFNPSDSLWLKPFSSLRLDVVAYGGGNQQITQSAYILVNSKENQSVEPKKTIQRGPRFVEDIFSYKNTQKTNFYSGFSDAPISNVSRLKILRLSEDTNFDSLSVDFVLLDENGNFCYEVSKHSSDIKLQIEQKCAGKFSTSEYLNLAKSFKIDERIDVHFIIDYSVLNDIPQIKQDIVESIKFLDIGDRVSLNFFGVRVANVIPLERSDKFLWDLEAFEFPRSNELSSVFYSLCSLIDNLEGETNTKVVLITNRMDNSSINYTLEDVISKAKSNKIAINCITFGNEVSPSVYRYLSSKTGGNFYHFPWKLSEIGKSLVEVILSSKYYFGAKIKFSRKELKCKDLDIIASVSFGNISFSDEYSFPIQDRTFYTNYQAVSLFEHSDTTIKDVFLPTIDNLANLLITHRNLTLELIGTASIGESYSDPVKLSLERALAVQKRLVSKGVYPSQIRTKGIGISKPIYPNEDDETSSLFNRRVEIRWLLPEILPFTIVVDTVSSEEQAERKVEFWEKLGYKSYYDRLFSRNQMMYKVVLWGYRTYEEAERDAVRVSRKFKKNAIVE